ncbi:Protein of unknown function [Gryllus bimaculatus]|nr:Protein of unknown function [Gryllus bimaculatus]
MPPPVSADQASRTVLSARFQDSSMCGRSEQGRRALALVAAAAALAALAPGRAAAAGAGAVENALPPPNDMQRLWEELGNVKTMMSGISVCARAGRNARRRGRVSADELSRFNTLYLGKLEHRMLAIATALSSVDSNVKNLQERAHVWDTFQLHVAAWNEQIKTLDKKVDILSRGHEKLDVMDGKLSALQALDYKVERVAGRVGEAEARLAALARSLDAHRDAHRDSYALFGDVAARGVVSTLRIIERKVDRLQKLICACDKEVQEVRCKS